MLALSVYLASYATNLLTFVMTYSILFGLGVGTAYTAPMVAGWNWFPEKKGLVSGAVLFGFGSGGFFFNLIGTSLVNPNKLQAIGGAFPAEVYTNHFS
jgi:MFS family permease